MSIISDQIKAAAIIVAITLILGTYAMAGGHKTGFGAISRTNQHGRGGHLHAIAPQAKPHGTPRGHHYGWEKGRHNPHHSSDVSPTPGASPSNG
jgi:hypothetical protein